MSKPHSERKLSARRHTEHRGAFGRQRDSAGAAVVLVVIPVLAIAAFVAVASIAQAVREKSWSLIWSIGWLLAVLVASLWTPTRQTLLAAAAWLDRPLAARPTS